MEVIRSRQNETIRRFTALQTDGAVRREVGEYVCAGEKLLREALSCGCEVTRVLWTQPWAQLPVTQVTPELLAYASPLKNSDGPVFTVKMRAPSREPPQYALVLENVQDPGNVGTVLRTADAFGADCVFLCGACADPYGPKTVRASMGAVFRQRVVSCGVSELPERLRGLPLYGAALHANSLDIRALPPGPKAVAVGNEGRGLTPELLALCAGTVIIPMRPCAESLNAGVAAAVALWEMRRAWPD